MRLLTHNYLKSTVRNTTKGYPLKIEATNVIYEESPYSEIMMSKMIEKIDLSSLRAAISDLQNSNLDLDFSIPELSDTVKDDTKLEELEEDERKKLHKLLFDIHVIEADLVCPDTQRKFPIKDGIPNMVLHEDEV